jgi:hypothetical protein
MQMSDADKPFGLACNEGLGVLVNEAKETTDDKHAEKGRHRRSACVVQQNRQAG